MDIGKGVRRARMPGSVPQFGAWDGRSETNYSAVFSEVRRTRKKKKQSISRHALGEERELLLKNIRDPRTAVPMRRRMKDEVMKKKLKKKVVTCFNWLFRSRS